MKSSDPAGSAAARSGASAPPASGKAGASGEIGPSSRITRLTMPRAGRPVKTLVSAVLVAGVARAAPARWSGAIVASGQKR